MEVILMPFDSKRQPVLCDGCHVGESKHNCSGNNAVVSGSKTGRPCECQKCSRATTTGSISQDLNNKLMRSFSGVD